eukprot:jgi/Chrzof1/4692/Cz14g23020.t1
MHMFPCYRAIQNYKEPAMLDMMDVQHSDVPLVNSKDRTTNTTPASTSSTHHVSQETSSHRHKHRRREPVLQCSSDEDLKLDVHKVYEQLQFCGLPQIEQSKHYGKLHSPAQAVVQQHPQQGVASSSYSQMQLQQ